MAATVCVVDVRKSRPTLFERLGGIDAVRAVVDEFYGRLLNDADLYFFFDDVKLATLKIHQLEFLKVAFTGVPAGVDVGALMMEKHQRLFATKGLNASHFDKVANHLVATLVHLNVAPELIDEAASVVLPLRPVFEKGAELYSSSRRSSEEDAGATSNGMMKENEPPLARTSLLGKLGGAATLRVVVEEMYGLLLEEPATAVFFENINLAWLKQHQIDFMKIAFAQVPKDLDVPAFVRDKHAALFAKGLTEKHFDWTTKFLAMAMEHAKLDQSLIDEALAIVNPLRSVFEQGAAEALERRQECRQVVN